VHGSTTVASRTNSFDKAAIFNNYIDMFYY